LADFLLQQLPKIGNSWCMPNMRKESSLKVKPTGISLPPELAREARKHAFSNGMSLSKFVSQLLLRELKSIQGLRFNAPEPTQAQVGLDSLTH
jgi:hypothetical protein